MTKLSDYTQQEITAVVTYFMGNGCADRFMIMHMTDDQKLRCINSFTGQRIILKIRFNKLISELKKTFRIIK